MLKELQDFIDTLPVDVQAHFSSDMKNRRVCAQLAKLDIEIPEDVQRAMEDYNLQVHQHDYVMDSMRPGMENALEDLPDAVSRV